MEMEGGDSMSAPERPRREPCRGGCGAMMPPGQKCAPCATAAVDAWLQAGHVSPATDAAEPEDRKSVV